MTFRKRHSRKYRSKNTRKNTRRNARRKYHKARKSRSNRRSRKSLEGGVITDADQAWWDHEKQAADEKAAEDKQVNEVMDALNISMEDAKEVVKLMKEGHNMDVARNIHRSNKEIKQINEKQVELEKS